MPLAKAWSHHAGERQVSYVGNDRGLLTEGADRSQATAFVGLDGDLPLPLHQAVYRAVFPPLPDTTS